MTTAVQPSTLQELIDSVPNLVDHFYANRKGSVVRDSVLRQPPQFVSPEFTNWRDEQRAWRESVALYNQSFHMTSTTYRGPDALAMFQYLAVNSFATFGIGKARHFLACNSDGLSVGDGILYQMAPDELVLVGRAAGHNWVQFHLETGDWDVSVERDEIFSENPAGKREVYRFQLEGPNAIPLFERLNGAPLPDHRRMDIIDIAIAGRRVRALKHTMAGGPGYEFWGPWEDYGPVHEAILEAGADYDLRQVGSMAYFSTGLELGWIPRPVPAIYTGEDTRAFREWLPATANEASWSLGGSYAAPNIEDYYVSPRDLGYGHLIKFDHDFVGREALEASAEQPHKEKVTLVWDAGDTAKVMESYMHPDELPGLYIDMPRATYATWQYDSVLDGSGATAGVAAYSGFSWNERAMLSLALVDSSIAEPGTRVEVVWGEPDGGARSPWLAPHRQFEIGATVHPSPIRKS